MSRYDHRFLWMRPDWMPQLQIIEWMRYTVLRTTHVLIVSEYLKAVRAGENVDTWEAKLCAHVEQVADELHACWHEFGEAVDVVRVATGQVPAFTASKVDIAGGLQAPDGGSADAINAYADLVQEEKALASMEHRKERKTLREDAEALTKFRDLWIGSGTASELRSEVAQVSPQSEQSRGIARLQTARTEAAA